MTPEQAIGLREHLVASLRNESQTTAKVLSAVPDDKASYKPEDTARSARDLVEHIAMVDLWFLQSVAAGSFDRPENPGGEPMKPSQVVAVYREQFPALLDKVAALDGDQLTKPIQFYSFNLPAVLYLDFCLRHGIHHRGQLSTYLRPMGAKVPSIYGGSADEPFDAAAASAS